MSTDQNNTYGEYIIIKAEESGVTISAVPLEDKENEYPVRLDPDFAPVMPAFK